MKIKENLHSNLNLLAVLVLMVLLTSCKQEATTPIAENQAPELVDRELYFGNPDKIQIRISPDGEYFSYRAPLEGVMNIWVAPIDAPDQANPVTKDTLRGVFAYVWSYRPGILLYAQDVGGDENWHVHKVNVETKQDEDLTPFENILGPDGVALVDPNTGKTVRPRAEILSVTKEDPNNILIRLNKTDPQSMDIYKISLDTNSLELVLKDDAYAGVTPDNLNRVRLASKMVPEGGMIVYKIDDKGTANEYIKVPQEDLLTFSFLGFDKSNENVYLSDSRGIDKAALFKMNLESGEQEIIAKNDKADITNVLVNPITYEVDAYEDNYFRSKWVALSDDLKEDLKYLEDFNDGDYGVYMRSVDDKTWIIAYDSPKEFLKYYKFDRNERKAEFLVSSKPAFDDVQLSNMYPIEITSRDGNKLVSYLTIPSEIDNNGSTDSPAPMVLLVHGGPWGRDGFGFNGMHQWLANRGYVVLSVNFRGSTGFGKEFINIAAEEWAGNMHNDLIDAVDWAVDKGIANKDKVAIMGGSYGGYATLVGMTFTPDVFACGVDIVGPSNLETLLNTIPPYWKSIRDLFVYHIGDPDTPEGKALLNERSPLTYVDSIQKPLLIGQGANDPRVKQSESDQIVEAMNQRSIPVTYVVYPDEGHGFARPENNLSFFAVTEMFLSKHLGGRYQEIGNDFEDSSIEIKDAGDLKELNKIKS